MKGQIDMEEVKHEGQPSKAQSFNGVALSFSQVFNEESLNHKLLNLTHSNSVQLPLTPFSQLETRQTSLNEFFTKREKTDEKSEKKVSQTVMHGNKPIPQDEKIPYYFKILSLNKQW